MHTCKTPAIDFDTLSGTKMMNAARLAAGLTILDLPLSTTALALDVVGAAVPAAVAPHIPADPDVTLPDLNAAEWFDGKMGARKNAWEITKV